MAPRKAAPKQKQAPAKSTNVVKERTAASGNFASTLLRKSTRRNTRSTEAIPDESILQELTPVPTTAYILNARRVPVVGQISGPGQLADAGQLPEPNWVRRLHTAIIRAPALAKSIANIAASTIHHLMVSVKDVGRCISPSALGFAVMGLLFLIERQDRWIVESQLAECMLAAGNRGC